MNIAEETLSSWAQGPSQTETERCENAEKAVRKAIAADDTLSQLDITVSAQGSYKARTNVKQDSDVDICVCYNSAFFPDYPDGKTRSDYGNTKSEFSFNEYKTLIERALVKYFGANTVKRGDKAFDIHANTYRIDADVVPTFEHRRYTGLINNDGTYNLIRGVGFLTDTGKRILNWPNQTYNNGIKRNDETGRRYKRIIRIMKRLRNKMQEDKIAEANDIASFLIECLVWNAPVEAFQNDEYNEDLRNVIASIWNRTNNEADCKEWGEVNELKYLFRSTQPWSRQQANNFLLAAWKYMGYK